MGASNQTPYSTHGFKQTWQLLLQPEATKMSFPFQLFFFVKCIIQYSTSKLATQRAILPVQINAYLGQLVTKRPRPQINTMGLVNILKSQEEGGLVIA